MAGGEPPSRPPVAEGGQEASTAGSQEPDSYERWWRETTLWQLWRGGGVLLAVSAALLHLHALPTADVIAALARGTCDWRCRRTLLLSLDVGIAALVCASPRLAFFRSCAADKLSQVYFGAFMLLALIASQASIGDGAANESVALLVMTGLVLSQASLFYWGGPSAAAMQTRLQAGALIAIAPAHLLGAALSPHGAASAPVLARHALAAGLLLALSLLSLRRVRHIKLAWLRYEAVLETLQREEAANDAVLSLLLPDTVMAAMKSSSDSVCFAEEFHSCSILFVELAHFSELAAVLSPAETLELLNMVFWEFDKLTTAAGLLKVETVGPVYMVASGVPAYRRDHCTALCRLALAMRDCLHEFPMPELPSTTPRHGRSSSATSPLAAAAATGGLDGSRSLQALMGIHAGPVIAGVVGVKLPRYRLFGDTVNTAARMQTHSQPGFIALSEAAESLVRADGAAAVHLKLVDRGLIEVKSKGRMQSYFLEHYEPPTPPSTSGYHSGPSAHNSGSHKLAASERVALSEAAADAEALPQRRMLRTTPSFQMNRQRTRNLLPTVPSMGDLAHLAEEGPSRSFTDDGSGPLMPPPGRPVPLELTAPPGLHGPLAQSAINLLFRLRESAPAVEPKGPDPAMLARRRSTLSAVPLSELRSALGPPPFKSKSSEVLCSLSADYSYVGAIETPPELVGLPPTKSRRSASFPTVRFAEEPQTCPAGDPKSLATVIAAARRLMGPAAPEVEDAPPFRGASSASTAVTPRRAPPSALRTVARAIATNMRARKMSLDLAGPEFMVPLNRVSTGSCGDSNTSTPSFASKLSDRMEAHVKSRSMDEARDSASGAMRASAESGAADEMEWATFDVHASLPGEDASARRSLGNRFGPQTRLSLDLYAIRASVPEDAPMSMAPSPGRCSLGARRSLDKFHSSFHRLSLERNKAMQRIVSAGSSGTAMPTHEGDGGHGGPICITIQASSGRGSLDQAGGYTEAPSAKGAHGGAAGGLSEANAGLAGLPALRLAIRAEPPARAKSPPRDAALPAGSPLGTPKLAQPRGRHQRTSSKDITASPTAREAFNRARRSSYMAVQLALGGSKTQASGASKPATAVASRSLAADALASSGPRRIPLKRHTTSSLPSLVIPDDEGSPEGQRSTSPPRRSVSFNHAVANREFPVSPSSSIGNDSFRSNPGNSGVGLASFGSRGSLNGSFRTLAPPPTPHASTSSQTLMPVTPRLSASASSSFNGSVSGHSLNSGSPGMLSRNDSGCVEEDDGTGMTPRKNSTDTAAPELVLSDITTNGWSLRFTNAKSEAQFVAEALGAVHDIATSSLRICGGSMILVGAGLCLTCPVFERRHAAVAAMLGAAAAAATFARISLIDRLMTRLYAPNCEVTLASVRWTIVVQFGASFLFGTALLQWAMFIRVVHLAPVVLALVVLSGLSETLLVFDSVGSLLVVLGSYVQYFICLLIVALTARAGRGMGGFSSVESLVLVPSMLGLLAAQMHAAARANEARLRRDHVLKAIAQNRKAISSYLISNMLPASVIEEIRHTKCAPAGRTSIGGPDAQLLAWQFKNVCILQSDIVGFTALGSRISPEALCGMLHDLFSDFDDLCSTIGVYKIETIGDAFIAATGCIPGSQGSLAASDARKIATLALAMQAHCENFTAPDGSRVQMRIGLAAGPALGGVVGSSMLRFHLFGDVVGKVSCYEQAAPHAGICCSPSFRTALEGESSGLAQIVQPPSRRLRRSRFSMDAPVCTHSSADGFGEDDEAAAAAEARDRRCSMDGVKKAGSSDGTVSPDARDDLPRHRNAGEFEFTQLPAIDYKGAHLPAWLLRPGPLSAERLAVRD